MLVTFPSHRIPDVETVGISFLKCSFCLMHVELVKRIIKLNEKFPGRISRTFHLFQFLSMDLGVNSIQEYFFFHFDLSL